VWSPFLRNLHDDPRWPAMREEVGLGAERLAASRIDRPDLK
jgi:hypothetical protein